MPEYSFRCQKCEATVVVAHAMTAEHPKKHKGCRGKLVRSYAPVDVIYKSAGFFTTDRRLDPRPEELD